MSSRFDIPTERIARHKAQERSRAIVELLGCAERGCTITTYDDPVTFGIHVVHGFNGRSDTHLFNLPLVTDWAGAYVGRWVDDGPAKRWEPLVPRPIAEWVAAIHRAEDEQSGRAAHREGWAEHARALCGLA